MSKSQSLIFEYLASRYPLFVSVAELSMIIGDPTQTIRNGLQKNTYPIPSLTRGRRRVFSLVKVAEYVDQQSGLSEVGGTSPRRRGRPTKVDQIRKQAIANGQ